MKHDVIKITARYLIIILLIILIYIYRNNLLNVLMPFMIGGIIAYLVYPLINYLENKGVRRSYSILIIFFAILIVILLLFLFLTPHITSEINEFISELPNIRYSAEEKLNVLEERLRSIPGVDEAISEFYDRANESFISLLEGLPDRVGSIFSSLLNIILAPIISFYILMDGEKIYANFYLLIPEKDRQTLEFIMRDVEGIINGYIRGQFYINLFVATFTAVGLAIIGVKLAIILGILTGILNFIPYFGPILAAIPTVMMALLDSPQKAIYALIIYLVVQQIESGILAPRILSENLGLHPLMVMFLLLLGQEFFGIIGMLVSVPLAAVIRRVLIRLAQL
ncbi:AI-2E family transporter [Calorimonas adulescens]|uniref:AI-2E family transporter n=1 Tax=Calorimonas adulescens TaxID=2606906 RepID=UPI001396AD63|nr:AI-2E family transporter [Calorimonas adulescens]